jgi:tetratricopeptide (TPR) repeat protein
MAVDSVNRRKHPRIRAPKSMWVGWRSAGQTSTARAENMGLGGLFLRTENPARHGSMLELVFELPTGDVRARAIVRRSMPGRGMGVQFIEMRPEDRARLNRYLTREVAMQEIPATLPRPESQPSNSYPVLVPQTEEMVRDRFEKEAQKLIELTGKGTYYQLLGVTSECSRGEVKRRYYELARKFHPDRHSGGGEFIGHLKELMSVTTEAYRTIENEQRRAAYDKSLADCGAFDMRRQKSKSEESLQEWLKRANECLRAGNFVGSIGSLRKCTDAAPDNASYHAMLARSLGSLPQYHNEAIEHFQRAIDLDPWKEAVYLQFADLLETMQLASRASAVYARLLEINPMQDKARERLGSLGGKGKGEGTPGRVSQLFGKKS